MLFGKNKKKENSFISEVDDSRVLVYDFRRRTNLLFENYRAVGYKKPENYHLEQLKSELTDTMTRLINANAVDAGNEDCSFTSIKVHTFCPYMYQILSGHIFSGTFTSCSYSGYFCSIFKSKTIGPRITSSLLSQRSTVGLEQLISSANSFCVRCSSFRSSLISFAVVYSGVINNFSFINLTFQLYNSRLFLY